MLLPQVVCGKVARVSLFPLWKCVIGRFFVCMCVCVVVVVFVFNLTVNILRILRFGLKRGCNALYEKSNF